ncbi:branched-chain amino acid transport system substrate-binding protein [Duganella sp. CF517]|uniref:branched-chain amino acid ABC transporter substrate-binding protein n=1 Tax=Duganella sp. CF517 TaxID=1881038 RepID=UPI0008C8F05A|nr:branched-chain amino acid ABC transporter substrate-binding protein [Duganella sp. CF517]SEO54020.1 branched-chain amino acid transport system substrate-binding protein [Duganella sp. CF517]
MTRIFPLLLGGLWSCAVMAQDVVKIGVAGPLSGEIAHLGKAMENGVALAIEDLNARGVTIGGRKAVFVMQSEDDAADPKQGTAVAQKLVDAGVKAVIGHANSGTTVPASRIYNAAGVVQISPSATTPAYTRQKFAGAFRVVANDNMLGSSLGRYAVNELGARRIAVIDDRSAYGQGVADEFIKSAEASVPGLKIIGREFTTAKASDFSAILTRIRAKKPDLVFFGGMDATAGGVLRQMKALGMALPFMGGDGICTEALPTLAGGTMRDGAVYCAEAGGIDAAHEKAVADFVARFHARFHSDIQTYAPHAYDATMTVAAAMRQAGSTDPVKFLPVLRQIQHPGLTGTIRFDANGDIRDGALTVSTYRAGKKTKLVVLR